MEFKFACNDLVEVTIMGFKKALSAGISLALLVQSQRILECIRNLQFSLEDLIIER